MGKGDKKSKRGKIIKGTHGKSRPRKIKSQITPKKLTATPETEASN